MEDQSFTTDTTPSPEKPREKKYAIQYTPGSQLGILIGMAFVGMIIGNIVAIVPFLIKGIGLMEMPSTINNPANVGLIRMAQIIGTFFTFLFPIWIFKKIVHPPKDFLHVKTRSNKEIWALVALIAFASLPVTDWFGSVNHWIPLPSRLARFFQRMEDGYNNQVVLMMRMNGITDLLVSLVIVALLPAIFEETFFRGALQNIMIQWMKKPYWAIILTSVIFSAIHFSYYGFLPRAFLGMLLGCVYYWTKDLKLNILIHFINNAISVIGFYVLSMRHELNSEKMNESLAWYYQLGGVIVFSVLVYLLYKSIQKQNAQANLI